MRTPATNRSLLLTGILIVLFGLLYGCMHRGQNETLSLNDLKPITSRPFTPNDSKPPASSTLSLGDLKPAARERLVLNASKSSASRRGIVICEPAVSRVDADTADFGAGCARWLQFEVGGLGELGRTPQWPSLERIRDELGRSDLRVSRQEAPKLAQILGVTHAAIGTISGSPMQSTLVYQLVTAPEGKALGKPLQVSGSQAQILAVLPGIARQLASRLGVESPRISAQVGARPEEVTMLGTLPIFPNLQITPTQIRKLGDLAQRMPLAGMLFLKFAYSQSDTRTDAAVSTLVQQAPDNALIYSQIGCVAPDRLPRLAVRLKAELQRFPNNYLFATANVWLQRERGDLAAEQKAAGQVVRCAPVNPDAWLTLGSTFDNETAAIRQGRYASEISAQEWQQINQIYPKWLQAVSRATRLDPHYGKAWLRVATAACFDGQYTLANVAFWKAFQLDPGRPDVCGWGLQMYQPKWLNDPDSLQKVAQMAVTASDFGMDSIALVEDLKDAKQDDDAQQLLAALIASNRALIARNPGDNEARYHLVWCLKEQGDTSGAIATCQQWIAQAPGDYRPHYALARIYDDQNRFDNAVPEYQAALSLDPEHRQAHYELGYDLKRKDQYDAAEREMRKAVEINPRSAMAYFGLGEIRNIRRQADAALAEYKKALGVDAGFGDAYMRLCEVYAQKNQLSAAIQAGEKAIMYDRKNGEAHGSLATAYGMHGDLAAAEREAREALRINPEDTISHETLGDALIELGRKEEAQSEWRLVLRMAPGSAVADEATQMLAKYP